MTLRKTIFVVAFCFVPSTASAQIQRSFNVGDRIRIYTPNTPTPSVKGKVTGIDAKTITLNLDGQRGDFFFLREEIRAIEVSTHRYRKTKKGLFIGGALGLAAGVIFAPKNNPTPVAGPQQSKSIWPTAIAGAGVGLAVGGLSGFATQRDVWAPVTLMPPR